jgi:hypothetical protein
LGQPRLPVGLLLGEPILGALFRCGLPVNGRSR